MAMIDVGDLKMARELFCTAQSDLIHDCWFPIKGNDTSDVEPKVAHFQKMIDQIDVLRPLGSNGKHGTLHTPYCGCDPVCHVSTDDIHGSYTCSCYLRRDHAKEILIPYEEIFIPYGNSDGDYEFDAES